MYQEFYANSDLMILPVIGLCIFFISFVLVLVWVLFGLRRGSMLDEMARLPLDDVPGVAGSGEAMAHGGGEGS